MDIGRTSDKQRHGGTQEKCTQRYMRTLQQGYTWNSVDRDRWKIIGRGTWEKDMQRYMGKLQVEVHGKSYGIATWEKHIHYPWKNVMMR